MIVKFLIQLSLSFFILDTAAFAYLDPVSLSTFFTVLLAAIASTLLNLKKITKKFLNLFKKNKKN